MAGLPINVLQGLAVDGEAEDKIKAITKGVLYDALSGYTSSRIEDIAGDAYAWLGKNRAGKSGGTDLATMTDDEFYRRVMAHMDAVTSDNSAGRAVPDNISAPGQTSDGLSDDEYFRMLQKFVDEGAAGETDDTLANPQKNGILYLDDIQIGRSVGAKAANYDVELPNGEIVHLTEGTRITDAETIAGKGRQRQIDEIDFLIEKWGGAASEWQKKKGHGYVDYDGESYYVELHWYEEPTVGRKKWKVKPDANGNWFIDD